MSALAFAGPVRCTLHGRVAARSNAVRYVKSPLSHSALRTTRRARVSYAALAPRAALLPQLGLAAAVPEALQMLGAHAVAALSAVRAVEFVFFQHVLAALTGLGSLIQMLANDPWDPEECLFIAAWVLAVRPVLRALYKVGRSLLRRPVKDLEAEFEGSFLAKCVMPLRQLGWAFASLWCFDNGTALAHATGALSLDSSSTLLQGTPTAIYLIWAGYVLLHVQRSLFANATNLTRNVGTRLMVERACALGTMAATAGAVSMVLGLDPSTLVAAGGLLGFAVSLAVKDLLTNLFSGISLAISRPFSEGDEVVFGATNVFRFSATVVRLGYVMTTLKDADSQLIYVPNSALANQTVTNSARRTHTRLAGELVIRYADVPRLESLVAAIVADLRALPHLDERTSPVAVTVSGFTPVGVAIKVTALFRREGVGKADAVRSAAWLSVGKTITREGCAFAQQ